MRRGFMNMFPNMIGPELFQHSFGREDNGKKNEPQKTPQSSANAQINVSVFATIDKDKNAKISFEEAKTNSVFGQDNVSAGLKPSAEQQQILKKGNIGFKFDGKLDNYLKSSFNNIKGNLSNIQKSFTYESQEVANSKADDRSAAEKELNGIVDAQLRSANANANTALMNAYQEALNKAVEQAQKNIEKEQAKAGESENGDKIKDNTTVEPEAQVDPNSLKVADTDSKGNKINQKVEKSTIASSYDTGKDGTVDYTDMESKFQNKYNNRVQIMTSNEDALKALGGKEGVEKQGNEMFTEALGSFNKHVGTKDMKISTDQERAKAAKYADSLNRKAEAAANKAIQDANKNVYTSLQRQVNQTISNTINGVEDAPPAQGGNPVDGVAGAKGKDVPNLAGIHKMAKGEGVPQLTKPTVKNPAGGGLDSTILAGAILQGMGTLADLVAPQLGIGGSNIGSQFASLGTEMIRQGTTNNTTSEPETKTDEPTQQPTKHTVGKNDTLASIAKKYGVTPQDIITANPTLKGTNPDTPINATKFKEIKLPKRA